METFDASVTFEFETAQPVTTKLTVGAGGPAAAMARAIRLVRLQGLPRGWRSVVCVLERRSVVRAPADTGTTAAIAVGKG